MDMLPEIRGKIFKFCQKITPFFFAIFVSGHHNFLEIFSAQKSFWQRDLAIIMIFDGMIDGVFKICDYLYLRLFQFIDRLGLSLDIFVINEPYQRGGSRHGT
jgi:hypothetical protein